MQGQKLPSRFGLNRLLVFASGLWLALVLVGCSGSGNGDSATPTSPPAPTATPGSTAAASATPGPTSVPAATADSRSGTPSASTRLPDLNSYRYTFRLEGTAGLIAEVSRSSLPTGVDPNTGTLAFVVKGSYLKPDRGEATISLGDTSLVQIVIGNQVWTNVGDGFKAPARLSASGDSDYSFVADLWDTSPTETLKDFTCGSSSETVNGVPTRKCTATKATVERLNKEGKLFTTGILDLDEFETASAEIWVTSADKVVRFRANLGGVDSSGRKVAFKMEVDITDINATFSINPPS